MSSSQKTSHLSLNQWSATDAPLRVDFNSDNQMIDNLASRTEARLQSLGYGVEDALFGVYALTMRAYYDNKPVPQRATLFFDGFSNYSQCDDALTTALLSNGLRHHDRYFGQGMAQSTAQRFVKQTQFTHVMKASGPFYLFEAKVNVSNQEVYLNSNVQLCTTPLDAQDKPTGAVAEVLSQFQVVNAYNSASRQHAFSLPAQGVYVDAGQYGLMLANPNMQAPPQYLEWINFSLFGRSAAAHTPVSYLYDNGALTPLAYPYSPLNGKLIYVNHPPVYHSKEITPVRPVSAATLFITCDSDSLANLRPALALYNPGDTPQYIALTNAPEENSSAADGLIESVWRLPAGVSATRARLRLQFDGLNPDNSVKQYGCILSE